MKFDEVYKIILNEDDSIVYLSDIDTYELLYLNRGALRLFGLPADYTEYRGKKCYKLLQGEDEPCSFCTNSLLTNENFYTWQHYNKILNRYLSVKDKLLNIEGRHVRLEIANDVTERELEKMRLTNELSIEKTLVKCIRKLSENKDFDSAVNDLLEDVCGFYGGDRAYIFEFNYEENIASNTHEWCNNSISPQMKNLQEISLKSIQHWCDRFREQGNLCIFSLKESLDKGSYEYPILEAQNIDSMIAVPLMEGTSIIGFIGVDNPKNNIQDMSLLNSITYFILNDLEKRRMLAKLELLSSMDDLTRIYNRTMYTQVLTSLQQNMPASIGIIYSDINGLKEANDTYGHDAGDSLIKQTADYLYDVFPGKCYRVGGDEFVVLCPDIEKSEFEEKVKQLRSQVECNKNLNISIGTLWTTEQSNPENLVSKTDKLMYIEKRRYYQLMGTEYSDAGK